jgi:hypothetical protein
MISITAIVFMALIGWYPIKEQWEKDHNKVFASPPEITLNDPTNKPFVLSITNNQEVAVYNVCLGVCLNYKTCDMSAIKIEPVIQEFLPGIPVSMTSVGLSNGCRGIVFGYIKPHTTKEFYVTIKGKKLSKGSRVAFKAYHWYLEPHFESITANKDYVFKGAPNNLNEIFDNKIDESSVVLQ